MKKLLLLIALLGQTVCAQQINVKSVELLKSTEAGGYHFAVYSPQGTYLLTSSANYTGLKQITLATGEVKTITQEPGAGYDVKISADESTILFKKTEYINNLRYTSLHQYSFTDKKTTKVESATREKLTPVFAQNEPMYAKGNKNLVKNAKAVVTTPIVTIEDMKMVVYSGSTSKVLAPNGTNANYFWANISPDGKHIVYHTTATHSTFVCNIDGTNPVSLGKLEAPVWLNNQLIVGMDSKDDGETVLSSSIVAVTADGKTRQILSTPSIKIAMYPAVSPNGKHIAFENEKGQIYLMNINVK
jgi:Tol biopolymer transport system component